MTEPNPNRLAELRELLAKLYEPGASEYMPIEEVRENLRRIGVNSDRVRAAVEQMLRNVTHESGAEPPASPAAQKIGPDQQHGQTSRGDVWEDEPPAVLSFAPVPVRMAASSKSDDEGSAEMNPLPMDLSGLSGIQFFADSAGEVYVRATDAGSHGEIQFDGQSIRLEDVAAFPGFLVLVDLGRYKLTKFHEMAIAEPGRHSVRWA